MLFRSLIYASPGTLVAIFFPTRHVDSVRAVRTEWCKVESIPQPRLRTCTTFFQKLFKVCLPSLFLSLTSLLPTDSYGIWFRTCNVVSGIPGMVMGGNQGHGNGEGGFPPQIGVIWHGIIIIVLLQAILCECAVMNSLCYRPNRADGS